MEWRAIDDAPILNVVGARVALGPNRRALIPIYTRWINDLGMLQTLATPPAPLTIEAETARFEEGVASVDLQFDIYKSPGPRPIGSCDLRDIDHRNRTAPMGMLIGEPDSRAKGFGSAPTTLLLDVAFTALGLHAAWLRVYADNLAGQRC